MRLLSVPLLALALAGCNPASVEVPVSETKTETVNIEAGKVERVRTDIHMGAGEIRIQGGAAKLLEGTFTYNSPGLKPEVRYDASSFRGSLVIRQTTDKLKVPGDLKNTWDLRLNNDILMDLVVNIGAGEGKLNLSGLSLRTLEMSMGAGEVDVDLTGDWKRNVEVKVRGGVGEATLRLPRTIGVEARAKGGIGEIKVRGLEKVGDVYQNAAFAKAPVKMYVDVAGGVGQINLLAE
jgi:hypothetical protein